MKKKIFTYILGGKAGQGIKKGGDVAANYFIDLKREVFQMNDYPSLIRGGHNYSVVSSSTSKIFSHYMNADLVVVLDQLSYKIHKNHVTENGILVFNSDKVKGKGIGIAISSESKNFAEPELIEGISGIAILAAVLSIEKKIFEKIMKSEYPKNVKDNISFGQSIYDQACDEIKQKIILKEGSKNKNMLSGSEAIALGAASAGLEFYFGYPMTPSTPILHYFGRYGNKFGVIAVQPENEIAVANMAIGASFTGAKSMVGTSGGGFCLMQEAFSLAGMAEAPVLFYLGQRPGPSTGVPTYTEQADLLFSLYPGQGEFPRVVASPGSVEEAFYLSSELLDLIWRFQTPAILLSEKHLAESRMSIRIDPQKTKWSKPLISKSKRYLRYRDTKTGISPLLFPPSEQLIKWSSYEHDEAGTTTENADVITKMHNKRLKKLNNMIKYLKNNIKTVNIYGEGPPLIFSFGSTTLSILEALEHKSMQAKVIQPIYLQPFPDWELKKYRNKKAIVIEQNSTGQFEQLLKEKIGIKPIASIRQFDGRPFDPIDLGKKLMEVKSI